MPVAAVRMLLCLVHHIDLLERHTRLVGVGVNRESVRFYHRRHLSVGNQFAQPVHMDLVAVARKDRVELVVRRSFDRDLVVGRDFAAEGRESGFRHIVAEAVVAHTDHAEEFLRKLELVGRNSAGRCRRSLGWTCSSSRMRIDLKRWIVVEAVVFYEAVFLG